MEDFFPNGRVENPLFRGSY